MNKGPRAGSRRAGLARPAWAGLAHSYRPGRRGGTALAVVALAVALSVAGATALLSAPVGRGSGSIAPGSPSPADHVAAPLVPGHEVYGFVPYWEIDDTIAAHLRATDASTIALFSVTNTPKGAITTSQNGFKAVDGPIGRGIVADAHRLGRRVDVTWTSFGRSRNDGLFSSRALQDKVIASLVALRADLAVDGIAVDVEDLADIDIPAYGAFVGRLRTALRTADPSVTVTVTTGAGPRGVALAVAANLAGADRIFLMGYDYRTVSSEPGASAPLSRGDGVDRSITWSLDLYAAAGVPVERTLLGLPLYGLSWPTVGGEPGSPKTGSGNVWVPRRNLAALVESAATAAFDPVEDVSFLATRDGKAWRSVYYDTPRSLRPKLAYANDHGLAGAGFWALGYDRGLSGYTALIGDFRAGRPMAPDAATP